MGFRLPEMLIADVLTAAGLVLFPGFAMLDRPAIRGAVVTACATRSCSAFPIAAALITLADPLVLAFFGRRWSEAAAVVQILAVGFLAGPLAQMTASAYMATRRVDVMLKLAVPQGLLLVVLIAIFVDDGIAAVAGCQAAARLVFVPIGVYVSTRVLGLRVRGLWSAAWPPLLAAAGMASGDGADRARDHLTVAGASRRRRARRRRLPGARLAARRRCAVEPVAARPQRMRGAPAARACRRRELAEDIEGI